MKGKLQNERGSATIEFIGMVPLVLLIMLILWQFLVAGYAVMVSQSAVNEAAKTYSVTDGSITEAIVAAKSVIDHAGGNLEFQSINAARNGNNFELTMYVKFNLIFVPDSIVGSLPPITFPRTINGRVME